MVPLPAQGHLNQLLHLSRLISSYEISVHFVCTTTHTRQAKTRLHGWDPLSTTNMNFHEFPATSFSNPLPNPNALTKFPIHVFPCLIATKHLREPVYKLVQKLSKKSKRIVIIYDSAVAHVVQDIRFIPNAESYSFQSISAFSLDSIYWEAMGKPDLPIEADSIREAPPMEEYHLDPLFVEFSKMIGEAQKFNSGDLFNTSRVIEALYLDLLAEQKTTGTGKNWAMGPFNPVTLLPPTVGTNHNRDKCIEWLDKQQEKNSVVFVSFGTTSSLSDDEINELALGLEKSEQKFIWVLRDADKGNIFDGDDLRIASLPEGFGERIRERGLIIRDWAPQLEILSHPSTGGFISHCGWNSCMESISLGVPIGTWPMHSDQPRNATLITKVLKIGVEIRDWGRRDEVASSITVEKAVRRLMVSIEGDEIRERAKQMGDSLRQSVMEDGISRDEMDSFIAHITR